MTRITVKVLEAKIDLIKTVAKRAGLTNATYGGGTFEGIHLYRHSGTCQVITYVGDSTGITELGNARGNLECARYLDGLYDALSAMVRFN